MYFVIVILVERCKLVINLCITIYCKKLVRILTECSLLLYSYIQACLYKAEVLFIKLLTFVG